MPRTFVDLRGWLRHETTPELDGNNVHNERSGDTVFFFGYPHVSVSAISIDSIVVKTTSNELPKALMASASDVSATGTRLLSNSAFNPYQDLEFRWTLTYSNGNPVEDLEEIIDPRDGTATNPYTDQISPEFDCIIREPGSYLLKLTVRGMSGTPLEVIEETATQAITVVANTLAHLWYDGTDGDDANDGLDPHGFALTNASYTEATKELTQVGFFSGYTHNVSMNYTERDNWIYLDNASTPGLYQIASKKDDDTVVLAVGLGGDESSLTSSDGPKKVFSGSASSGTEYHLKGGATYTLTNSFDGGNKANPIVLSQYGADVATITSASLGNLVDFGTSASGNAPVYLRASKVNIDADGNGGTLQAINTSTVDTDDTTIILDRANFVNSDNSIGLNIQSTFSKPKDMNLLVYGVYVDNRYGTTGKAASKHAIFTGIDNTAWQRFFGCTLDNDADNSTLDHFLYPNGYMNHFHAAYMNCRNGSGNNYGFNINCTQACNYICVNNNFFGPNSNWAIDGSNATNESLTKVYHNVVVLNNKANVTDGFTLHYTYQTGYFAYNEAWGGDAGRDMFRLGIGSGFDPDNYQGVLYKNNVYGQSLCSFRSGSTKEIVDNAVFQPTDDVTLKFDPIDLDAREFIAQDNILYAPNKTSSTIIQSDGSDITLAAFNASSANISGNISSDPGWTDPANGSFDGTPLGLEVTVV